MRKYFAIAGPSLAAVGVVLMLIIWVKWGLAPVVELHNNSRVTLRDVSITLSYSEKGRVGRHVYRFDSVEPSRKVRISVNNSDIYTGAVSFVVDKARIEYEVLGISTRGETWVISVGDNEVEGYHTFIFGDGSRSGVTKGRRLSGAMPVVPPEKSAGQ